MKSSSDCRAQANLFSEPTPTLTIEIHGIGKVPSFKTGKRAFGWIDKVTKKIMARPITLPEHRIWMQKAMLLIASKLRSDFQIAEGLTPTDASLRSLMSLLPSDDCWLVIPEHSVNCELCEPGNEGATIRITRIN